MAKRMKDATAGNPPGPTSLGGQTTDGEETAGTTGSMYRGVLVERANKAATRNQHAGRTPLLNTDIPVISQDSRKTGRISG